MKTWSVKNLSNTLQRTTTNRKEAHLILILNLALFRLLNCIWQAKITGVGSVQTEVTTKLFCYLHTHARRVLHHLWHRQARRRKARRWSHQRAWCMAILLRLIWGLIMCLLRWMTTILPIACIDASTTLGWACITWCGCWLCAHKGKKWPFSERTIIQNY